MPTASAVTPPISRRLLAVAATPPPAPGFIGEGHTAVEVLRPGRLAESDPFVLLMDDRLDLPARRQIGGAHPHAGLETVTLVLEGSLHDRDEGTLSAGDAVWMTAGRGVIHNEHVEVEGKVRILQLWIGLPTRSREAEPSLQVLRGGSLPVRRERGAEVRVYSGRSGQAEAPTRNLVPVTLLEILLGAGASITQELPASYNGFVYVIEGGLASGVDAIAMKKGDVAWLDRTTTTGSSTLTVSATAEGARVVLYAGEPQKEPLIQRGPFVAESPAGLSRLFQRYQSSGFKRLSEIKPS